MKRFFAFFGVAILLCASPVAHAQEEQYVQVYNLIQDADASAVSEAPTLTLNKYLRAQAELQKFQKVYPDWNGRIVNFRLNYLATKIADLSSRTPALVTLKANPTPSATPPTPAQVQTASSSDIQSQLNLLRDQISQLQSDNSLLQAKVKEAFSAVPAAADPRELAKAADKIKSVTKENELLKTSLAQEKASKPADPREVERLKQQLTDARHATTEQTERASTLAQEKLALLNQLLSLAATRNTSGTDALNKSFAEASRKFNDQLQFTTQLQSEKAALQSRVAALSVEVEADDALRAENLLLKKQLTDLKLAGASGPNDDATRKLAAAQAQIATLQSDKEMLRLEKVALQQQVKQLTLVNVTTAQAAAAPENTQRSKQLESERDALQTKLNVAQTELSSRKNRATTSQLDDLRGQLEVLRTRIAVYQIPAVPYTKDELALFHRPEQMSVATAAPGFEKKSAKELPSGSLSLVNDAQRDFALGRYASAETKYLRVLKQDDKNIYTLANLAAIQLELNHLEASEKHVQQALALSPEDPYSLSILGNLKFRQGKWDDALDALARAAKLDPKNAEVQNHLGLVLSQKGLRKEAENALRRSVELDPTYASAHNNLAVVYITQKPPSPALAKWHYQKARDLGMPANPQLEKMLETTAGTPTQP